MVHRSITFSIKRRQIAGAEIDLALPDAHHAAAIDFEAGDSLDRVARPVGAHHLLGGLVDIDGLDAQVVAPREMVQDRRDCPHNLRGAQRIERMGESRETMCWRGVLNGLVHRHFLFH
jgi:hypothetical protein